MYQFEIGNGLDLASVAVDQTGRVYLAGNTVTRGIQTTPGAFQQTLPDGGTHAFVLRLNAAGTAIDYATYLAGSRNDEAMGIAVDPSDSALVAGTTQSTDFPTTPGAYSTVGNATYGVGFLTRLALDGSALIYSTLLGRPGPGPNAGPAVDPNGNAAVGSGYLLQRFDAAGALAFSKTLPPISSMAADSAGNVYVSGYNLAASYPVKNSLTTCAPNSPGYLTVLDSAGDILQSTYLPPGLLVGNGLALSPGSVYVLGEPANAQEAGFSLTQLSANAAAQPLQLACVGNAASFDPGRIAAGELVSLFGQGLGPTQGTQPQVDLKSGYPSQVANVRVTFNGTAAPLIYVQDSQINAIAPWSLAGASTAEICVFYNGTPTNCLERTVTATAPGVFTTDGYHVAALNQDGTVNSAANPAAPGSIVSIFATGLGPINPSQSDGSIVLPPLPTNTMTTQIYAQIGGIAFVMLPLAIQYAGPAPYEVAGVSQINFSVLDAALLLAGDSSFFGIYVGANDRLFNSAMINIC